MNLNEFGMSWQIWGTSSAKTEISFGLLIIHHGKDCLDYKQTFVYFSPCRNSSIKILIFEIQTILDSNTISKFHSWNKKPPSITCKIHETCLQKSFYLFKVIPTLRYHHQSLTKVLVTHWKRDGKEKAPRKPFQ